MMIMIAAMWMMIMFDDGNVNGNVDDDNDSCNVDDDNV